MGQSILSIKALNIRNKNNEIIIDAIDIYGELYEISVSDIFNGEIKNINNLSLSKDKIQLIKDPYTTLYNLILSKLCLENELLPLKLNYTKPENGTITNSSIITVYDSGSNIVKIGENSKGKRRTLQKLADIKLKNKDNTGLIINTLIYALSKDILNNYEIEDSLWYSLSNIIKWLKPLDSSGNHCKHSFPFDYESCAIESLYDIADIIVHTLNKCKLIILDTSKIYHRAGLNIASLYKDEIIKVAKA